MSDPMAEQFEQGRPRLQAIAHRMLGSANEADDAVQEVWLRLCRVDPETIENLGGWLTTVVSRVCLDMLRARRSRREELGTELDQSATAPAGQAEPEQGVLLAESLGPALAVVLDVLDPLERLAFVLHDLFAVPFAEIAPIVDRSPAATRQLASRARRRLREPPAAAPGPSAGARQSELVDAFLAASRQGDFEALLAVLDPEVVLRADPVAVRSATARQARGAPALDEETRGRDAVARIFVGRAAGAQPALVDGVPGAVVVVADGRTLAAFTMRSRDGRISEIELIADPRRLRALEVQLASAGPSHGARHEQ